MDDVLRKLLYKKFDLGPVRISVLDILLGLCITGTGVLLRRSVMHYTPMTLLKWIRMGLDFLMAGLGAAYILSRTQRKAPAILTYALMVIWPIFTANSSLWGKSGVYCGIILILGLLALERGMGFVCLEAVAAAMFLAFLEFPKPQAEDLLTLGWPNFYELTGKFMFVDLYKKVAWLLILGLFACILYCLWRYQVQLTRELMLPLFLFLALFVPFFAPFMPAWAGYCADVLGILFAVTVPKKFYVPMLHLVVSYSAYAFALNGESKLPMAVFSLILLGLMLDVGAYACQIMEGTEEEIWQQM